MAHLAAAWPDQVLVISFLLILCIVVIVAICLSRLPCAAFHSRSRLRAVAKSMPLGSPCSTHAIERNSSAKTFRRSR